MNIFGKSETPANRIHDGRHCDLCGCSFPAVRCDKCSSQIFCLSCDDMYHRHPKRHFHLRKAVDPTPTPQARPMLPMKVSNLPLAPGDPSKMPLPPPRKKKPGKSIFDSFRRASPSNVDASPGIPKKEYSWTDRLGSITKFMSNRPLPPVPVSEPEEDVPPPVQHAPDHSMSFIHKRVEEKPPALPQRQPRSQNETPSPTNGENNYMKPMTNGNGPAPFHTKMQNSEVNQNWMMNQNSHPQVMSQPFGTIRRTNQPQERSNASGAMQHSSSTSDLTAAPDTNPMPGPYPPHPFNPHMAPSYPYPMFPQYPPYPQYFGNSWANLASPVPSTDPDLSDQSESSSRRFNRGKHKGHFDKKAKRSQSVMVDRMAYPGQFYPYGPFPPGYIAPPWMQGHPVDAPPSPATSLRSLSRLSGSQRKKKATDDDEDDYEDDFSSSPLSRPKSSSSEVSKNRMRAKHRSISSSSSSEQESRGKSHSKPKPSPAMERRNLKLQESKRRMPSPSPPAVPQSEQEVKKDIAKPSTSSLAKTDAVISERDSPTKKQIPEANSIRNAGGSWECRHCTFINPSEERICQVCCKTCSQGETSITPVDIRRTSADSIKSQTGDEEYHDADSSHKRDIESLNTALDEAEKQINQSLVELLRVKEETSVEKSSSKPKKSFLKKFSSKKKPNDKGQEVSDSAVKVSHLAKSSSGTSPNLRNFGTSSENASKNNQVNQNTDQHKTIADAGTQSCIDKPHIEDPYDKTSRDSFCQTYQDIEEAVASTSSYQNNQRPYERTAFLPPASPTMDWQQHMIPDVGYGAGYGGLHRALSQASVFRSRTANNMVSPVDFSNSASLGPSSLYRSLSRASLLGEMENFGYMGRSKPDFYLSMEELVERRRQETMRAQGLELVRMIREAEQQGFTADDIQVALNNCGKQNPVSWLQENWKNIIKTVVTLATNYGKDKKENDVGFISENEAREALRFHKGNIWAAVTECVEGRQRKFLELNARGNFSFKDVVDALTASEGDVEIAYAKLSNTSIKPFLMRIWGSGEGVPNLEGPCFVPIDRGSFHESTRTDDSEDIGDTWEDDYGEDENWVNEDEEDEEEDEKEEQFASVAVSSPDIEGYASDELEKSEKYHTLTRDNIRSPESDKSDYCDAFGSGLGERVLSSTSITSITSIDEIYLIDSEIANAQFNSQPKHTPKKSTGFLSKLAALRKDSKSNKSKKADSPENQKSTSEEVKVGEMSTSEKEVEEMPTSKKEVEETSEKTFHPFSILKNTFTSLKESVVGATPKPEKKSLSIQDRRTIIVHDQPLPVVIPETADKSDISKEIFNSLSQEATVSTKTNNATASNNTNELVNFNESSKEMFTENFEDSTKGLSPVEIENSEVLNVEYEEDLSEPVEEHSPIPTLSPDKLSIQNEEEEIVCQFNYEVSDNQRSLNPFEEKDHHDGATNVSNLSKCSDKLLISIDNKGLEDSLNITSSKDISNIKSSESIKNDAIPTQKRNHPQKSVDVKLADVFSSKKDVVDDLERGPVLTTKEDNKLLEINKSGSAKQECLQSESQLLSSENNTVDETNIPIQANLYTDQVEDVTNNKIPLDVNSIPEFKEKSLTAEEKVEVLLTVDFPQQDDKNTKTIELKNEIQLDEKAVDSKDVDETILQNDKIVEETTHDQNQLTDELADVENKENLSKVLTSGDLVDNVENISQDKTLELKCIEPETNIVIVQTVEEASTNIQKQNSEVTEDDKYKNEVQIPLESSSADTKDDKILEKEDIIATNVSVENIITTKDTDVTKVEKPSENKIVKKKKKKKVETKIDTTDSDRPSISTATAITNDNAEVVERNVDSEMPLQNEKANQSTELPTVQNDDSNIPIEDQIEEIVKMDTPFNNELQATEKVENLDAEPKIMNLNAESNVVNLNAEPNVANSIVKLKVESSKDERKISNSNTETKIVNSSTEVKVANSNSEVKVANSNSEVKVANADVEPKDVENKDEQTLSSKENVLQISETQSNSTEKILKEPDSSSQIPIQENNNSSPEISVEENVASNVIEKLISTINSSIAVLSEPVIADSTASSSKAETQPESILTLPKTNEPSSVQSNQLEGVQESHSSTNEKTHSEQQAEKVPSLPEPDANDVDVAIPDSTVRETPVSEDIAASANTSMSSTQDIEIKSLKIQSQKSSSFEEDEENDDIEEDILNQTPIGPIRPAGHLRRMSFNTRKEAIFRERNRDSLILEKKPWYVEKKIDTFKPALPKRSIKQQLEFERKVRKLVADRKCATYRKAEIVAQLVELKFEEVEAIYAANECSNFDMAVSFLQQECQLCAGKYAAGEIISMVHCSHKACKECIRAYFTIQIRDRTIMELLCPFCNEPDITDEDIAQDYFNHLDIMLKKLVDEDIHELFQRKLRDRVLMKDPNFRWCSQCSSGFITDPYLKRLICPDCNAITCALCRRLWEREHEGVTCEVFADWKGINDPEAQTLGLAKLLTEDGIDCPSCHFRYALAKGGCMHFKCLQCQHDFCSGCSRPFKMGKKCGLSEFCVKLGLHAHHPRNCLFYLRDKEPEDLQRLLDMGEINYDKGSLKNTEDRRLCEVMEQKETVQGMVDDICGKEIQDGYAGLCRIHYVEYLGQLVNKYKIDPIQIFDNDDLELVLKRASIRLPPKKYRESEFEYREKLVQLIEEKLPIGEHEVS